MMSATLFASSNLESALERLPKFSNHSFAPLQYNPFEEKRVIEQTTMHSSIVTQANEQIILKSIFNNRAFINGNWRALGESVGDYRVVLIEDERVVLQKNGKEESFSLRDRKRNFFNLQKGSQ